ncbi:MAG: hypothetical protein WA705_10770 [Candidatus Ozemobacteraceae bacterium]
MQTIGTINASLNRSRYARAAAHAKETVESIGGAIPSVGSRPHPRKDEGPNTGARRAMSLRPPN